MVAEKATLVVVSKIEEAQLIEYRFSVTKRATARISSEPDDTLWRGGEGVVQNGAGWATQKLHRMGAFWSRAS